MSCNGCRVLRKGCSETCILRSCLQWIESPEAQGHATVFVAKFFGRAGMISFISAVAESERPALFQSLLYEACGRTVNPVFGAVGLLWSGNWGICQAAVETVLRGGVLKPASFCPPSARPMEPLTPQQRNPSVKRPHSLTEADMNFTVEGKRVRCSDQHEERPELRCKADLAHVDHGMPAFLPNCEINTIRNSAFLGLRHEQRPSSCGQLIAPVARRVKPQADYGHATMIISKEHQQTSTGQERQSHQVVQLDLSLNSHGNMVDWAVEGQDHGKPTANPNQVTECNVDHTTVKSTSLCNEEDQHAPFVDQSVQVSSPCSFSMNSEGSVTSLDTVEFPVSCIRACSRATSRPEECHLLHLL